MTCVFCDIVAGKAEANVVARWSDATAIEPLNPVTEGHVLFIPNVHVKDAVEDPNVTAKLMFWATSWAVTYGPCNFITSVGPAATQSVYHLHIHIVPRSWDDGLMLPWGTNEEHKRTYFDNAYQFYNG